MLFGFSGIIFGGLLGALGAVVGWLIAQLVAVFFWGEPWHVAAPKAPDSVQLSAAQKTGGLLRLFGAILAGVTGVMLMILQPGDFQNFGVSRNGALLPLSIGAIMLVIGFVLRRKP